MHINIVNGPIKVLPCLNEVKVAREPEQQTAYTIVDFVESGTKCSSKNVYSDARGNQESTCTKNIGGTNSLQYYPYSRLEPNYVETFRRDTDRNPPKKSCDMYTAESLLRMIFRMAKESHIGNHNNIFIIATHHNRMKGNYSKTRPLKNVVNFITGQHRIEFEGFFPIGHRSFANCCCISLSHGRVECVFGGFPDKLGEYIFPREDCSSQDRIDLHLALDPSARERLIALSYEIPMGVEFIFVRHGNSLHNAPLKVKTRDSSLTTVGIQQAMHAGTAIYQHIHKKESEDRVYVHPCASYLFRAQHTVALIAERIGHLFAVDPTSTYHKETHIPERVQRFVRWANEEAQRREISVIRR